MADKPSDTPSVSVSPRRSNVELVSLQPGTTKPGMVYRWCRNESLNIAKRKAQGYAVTQEASGVKPVVEDYDSKGKGTIVIADMILMETSTANYKEGRRIIHARSADRMSTGKEKFNEQAERHGVVVVDNSKTERD